MTILCAVTCLLQFVGLVALTGVLVCLVAVLRLMELAITLINPFTIFMLHQSGKIIIFGLRKSKRLTSNAYHKIRMDCGRAPILELEIGIHQPEVLYYRNVVSGLMEETFPREGDNYRAVQMSEVASVDQDDEGQDEQEIKVHSPDELEVEKVDEDREIEEADDDRETEKSASEEIG
ncbi:uncharacterized protein LOC126925629 [Bombus affinis]|uniref:uncharacterized protein LOC126925629 n=1 Tax=Bombus affinis TaxID=309941 RepID=UPI0021B71724|nr:uncharacterized protein LOC126925629 [Bombus affinis]